MLVGYLGVSPTGLLPRMGAARVGHDDGGDLSWEDGRMGCSLWPRPGDLDVSDDLVVAVEGELYGPGAGATGDARAVAGAFRRRGVAFAQGLSGSFAIAIYERLARRLHLVSDHVSTHPVFYAPADGILVFGTQIAPLLASERVSRRLDPVGVLQLMSFGCVFGERSLVDGVKYVPPASVVSVDPGPRVEVRPYETFRFRPASRPAQEWRRRIAGALQEAAAERFAKSEEPAMLLLSAGGDSRGLLAVARRPLLCVTLGDWMNREARSAARVARLAGQEFLFVQRDQTYYADGLREAALIGGGQHRFDHLGHFVSLAKRRELPRVVYTGFPADTYLKGTRLPYRSLTLFGRNLGLPVLRRLRTLDEARHFVWEHCAARAGLPLTDRVLRGPWRRERQDVIVATSDAAVRAALDANATLSEVGQFVAAERMNQQRVFGNVLALRPYKLERSVYLDRRIHALYLELPLEARANGTLFRQALAPVWGGLAGVPEANTGVAAHRSAWSRTAGKAWLVLREGSARYHENTSWPLFPNLLRGPVFRAWLDRLPGLADDRLFDAAEIGRVVQEHREGVDHAGLLLTLLTLCTWMREVNVAA